MFFLARCEYFRGLFTDSWNDSKITELKVTDFSFDVVYAVFRCMYGGRLNDPKNLAYDMVIVADKVGHIKIS